jgi:NAD-dependent deacetylase
LDEKTINNAIDSIRNADVLIVGGTSLMVYPAAGLIRYYMGNKMVLINKDKTDYDRFANLVINDSLGKVFEAIEAK